MVKRNLLIFDINGLVLLVFMQIFSLGIFGQTFTNSINGVVYSETGQPVSNVYVELQNDTYSTLRRVKTNGTGLYSFRGLKSGYYFVKVLPYGTNYREQGQRVALVGVSAGPGRGSVSKQLDFSLHVKRDANANPLAAPGVLFVQNVPKEAELLYKKGVKFLGKKQEKEGIDSLIMAVERHPNYYYALDRLGYEYVKLGHYRPAYVLLSKALEVNPKSFSSRVAFGVTQFKLNLVNDSVNSLKDALKIYQDSVYANVWLGIALSKKDKLDEAETVLLKANKLAKGKSANVHFQLARLYMKQRRSIDAAKSLERYLKRNPDAENIEEVKKIIRKLKVTPKET